jgi:hypothetical protein
MARMHGESRGAPRRPGHGRRAALWPFVVSQRGKREDDDDDVGVMQSGPHLAVSPGGAR